MTAVKEKEEIIAKINEFLVEEFEVEPDKIQPEANLKETLNLDSLDYVDLVVVIESNFGFKVKGEDFINIKKAGWERLTAILDRSQLGGLAALSAEELSELGRLYRGATSDLAVARRDFAGHRVADYLNGLVARAHAAVYGSRAAQRRSIIDFYARTFPRTFRATWAYTLAAFLMFLLPALASFYVAYRDPAAGAALMPGIEDRIQDIRDKREWWKELNDGNAAGASMIMTNNIQVAIMAFAGGTLLGVFTLYLLAQNGLMLGIVAGAAQSLGFATNLWGFVAAHGVIELSVIFIAGGAGLQLGWSVIRRAPRLRRFPQRHCPKRRCHPWT